MTSSSMKTKTPVSMYSEQFTPILEGSIKSKCLDGCFYKHYYELTPHCLIQYQSKTEKELLLCIDFRAVEITRFHKTDCCIKIEFSEQKIILKAHTIEEAQKWYSSLLTVIEKCLESQYINNSYRKFNEISITVLQLSFFADTFDLLLFKSVNKTSKLQRFLTGTTYDHIGLLLVTQNNQIFMIESNSKTGVCLLDQKSIRSKIKNSSKVAYRKLLTKRNNNTLQKFQKNLSSFIGCQFQFSLSKLFGNSKSKTYFCSQLVAQIYKRCQLLKTPKQSKKYWPGDFEQNKRIDNLQFGELMTIHI